MRPIFFALLAALLVLTAVNIAWATPETTPYYSGKAYPVPTLSPAPVYEQNAPSLQSYELTSSATTGCQSISTSAAALLEVVASAAAGTDIGLYDEGVSPTCTAADLIVDPTPTANQILVFAAPFGHPLAHGLAYKATTASITANIWIDYR